MGRKEKSMRWVHVDFYFNSVYKDKYGKYDKHLNSKEQVMLYIILPFFSRMTGMTYFWIPKPYSTD